MHHNHLMAGFASLTEREKEILPYVVAGYTYGEIGKLLYISELTVRSHMSRMLSKMDVSDRGKLAARCYVFGLVHYEIVYRLVWSQLDMLEAGNG